MLSYELTSGQHLAVVREWMLTHCHMGEHLAWCSNEQITPTPTVEEMEHLSSLIATITINEWKERFFKLGQMVSSKDFDTYDKLKLIQCKKEIEFAIKEGLLQDDTILKQIEKRLDI